MGQRRHRRRGLRAGAPRPRPSYAPPAALRVLRCAALALAWLSAGDPDGAVVVDAAPGCLLRRADGTRWLEAQAACNAADPADVEVPLQTNYVNLGTGDDAWPSGTAISGVSAGAFDSVVVDNEFHLAVPFAGEIPALAFSGLTAASAYIQIGATGAEARLAPAAFSGATITSTLSLANSSLGVLEAGTLSNLALSTLDLRNASLTGIKAGAFDSTTVGQSLELADNQLPFVAEGALPSLSSPPQSAWSSNPWDIGAAHCLERTVVGQDICEAVTLRAVNTLQTTATYESLSYLPFVLEVSSTGAASTVAASEDLWYAVSAVSGNWDNVGGRSSSARADGTTTHYFGVDRASLQRSRAELDGARMTVSLYTKLESVQSGKTTARLESEVTIHTDAEPGCMINIGDSQRYLNSATDGGCDPREVDVHTQLVDEYSNFGFDSLSIQGLQAGAFDGVRVQESFFMRYNSLGVLPTEAFVGLDLGGLLTLELSGVTGIEVDAFAGISTGSNLILRGNTINVLKKRALADVTTEGHIMLDNCGLEFIEPGAFEGTVIGASLFLGRNQLQWVPEGALPYANGGYADEFGIGGSQGVANPWDVDAAYCLRRTLQQVEVCEAVTLEFVNTPPSTASMVSSGYIPVVLSVTSTGTASTFASQTGAVYDVTVVSDPTLSMPAQPLGVPDGSTEHYVDAAPLLAGKTREEIHGMQLVVSIWVPLDGIEAGKTSVPLQVNVTIDGEAEPGCVVSLDDGTNRINSAMNGGCDPRVVSVSTQFLAIQSEASPSSISGIESDAFFGVTFSLQLFITSGTVGVLPPRAFSALRVESQLGVTTCGVTGIAAGAMDGLYVHVNFFLHGNNVGPLQAHAFSGAEVGGSVFMYNSGITRIEADAFEDFDVTGVSLRENLIEFAAEGELRRGFNADDDWGNNPWGFGLPHCLTRTVQGHSICEAVTIRPSAAALTVVSFTSLSYVAVVLEVASTGPASTTAASADVAYEAFSTALAPFPSVNGTLGPADGHIVRYVDASALFQGMSRESLHGRHLTFRFTVPLDAVEEGKTSWPLEYNVTIDTSTQPGCVVHDIGAGARFIRASTVSDDACDPRSNAVVLQLPSQPGKSVDLSGFNIHGIDTGAFNDLSLSSLVLNANEIGEILPETFAGLRVESADGSGETSLIGAGVSRVSPGAFEGFWTDGTLDLSENGIHVLESGSLAGLHIGGDLRIERCGLAGVQPHALIGTAVGRTLGLTDNALQTLAAGSLTNVTTRDLELSRAGLVVIEAGALRDATVSNWLDLSNNTLRFVPEGEIEGPGSASGTVDGNPWAFGEAYCLPREIFGSTVCEAVTLHIADEATMPTTVSHTSMAYMRYDIEIASSGSASDAAALINVEYAVRVTSHPALPQIFGTLSVADGTPQYVDARPCFDGLTKDEFHGAELEVTMWIPLDDGEESGKTSFPFVASATVKTEVDPGCVVGEGRRFVNAPSADGCNPHLHTVMTQLTAEYTGDLNLQALRLSGIQPGAFSGVVVAGALLLDGNQLGPIEAGALANITAYRIDLTAAGVTAIRPGAFSGAVIYGDCRLPSNRLGVLPRGAFSDIELLGGTLQLELSGISRVEPGSLPSSVGGSILLRGNNLGTLEPLAFGHLTAAEISVASAGITGIDAYAFYGSSVDTVDLKDNSVGVLVTNSIAGIDAGLIYFSDYAQGSDSAAGVTGIEPFAFNGTVVHDAITIDHNEVTELPGNALAGLVVNEFRMRHCGIRAVRSGAAEGLLAGYFDLSLNALDTIEPFAFNGLVATTFAMQVQLSEELVIMEGALAGMESVDTLIAQNSRISDIAVGAFRGSVMNTLLNLNGNAIQTLRRGAFEFEQAPEQLTMVDNAIETIEVGALDAFGDATTTLHLAGNNLPYIPAGALRELPLDVEVDDFGEGGNPWIFGSPTCLERVVLGQRICEALVLRHERELNVVGWDGLADVQVRVAAATSGPVSSTWWYLRYEVVVVSHPELPPVSGTGANSSSVVSVDASEPFDTVDREAADGAQLWLRIVAYRDDYESLPLDANLTLDSIAPVTTFASVPARFSQSPTALIELSCSEVGCSFAYSLDGAEERPVGGGRSGAGGGGVASSDATAATVVAGDAGAVPPTVVPAGVSVALPLEGVYVDSSAADGAGVRRTAANASFVARLDGGEPRLLTQAAAAMWQSPTDLSEGMHTLHATARRVSGADAPPAAVSSLVSWRVDATAPQLSVEATAAGAIATEGPNATTLLAEQVTVVSCGDDVCDYVEVRRHGAGDDAWVRADTRAVRHDSAVDIRGVDFAGNVGPRVAVSAPLALPLPPAVEVITAPPSDYVIGGTEQLHAGRVTWAVVAPAASLGSPVGFEVQSTVLPAVECGASEDTWMRTAATSWVVDLQPQVGVRCAVSLQIRAVDAVGQTGPEATVSWLVSRRRPEFEVLRAPAVDAPVHVNALDGAGAVVVGASRGAEVQRIYFATPSALCGAANDTNAQWAAVPGFVFVAPAPTAQNVECTAVLRLRAVDPATGDASDEQTVTWTFAALWRAPRPTVLERPPVVAPAAYAPGAAAPPLRVVWAPICASVTGCIAQQRVRSWSHGAAQPADDSAEPWEIAEDQGALEIISPREGGNWRVELRAVVAGFPGEVAVVQWSVTAASHERAEVAAQLLAAQPLPADDTGDEAAVVLPWEPAPWALLGASGGAAAVQYRVHRQSTNTTITTDWQLAAPTRPIVIDVSTSDGGDAADEVQVEARGIDARGWEGAAAVTTWIRWRSAPLRLTLPPGAAPPAGAVSPSATALFNPQLPDSDAVLSRALAAGVRVQFRFGAAPPPPDPSTEVIAEPWVWASTAAAATIAIGPLPNGDYWVHMRTVVGDGSGARTGAVLQHVWSIESTGASSIPLTNLAEGEHTLAATATDPANNVGPAATVTWAVDSTPPAVALVPSGSFVDAGAVAARLTSNDTVQWTAVVTDASRVDEAPQPCDASRCTLRWRLARPGEAVHNAAWQDDLMNIDGRAPLVVTSEADGDYTVEVNVIDAAGNEAATSAVESWRVDSQPPALGGATFEGGVGVPGGPTVPMRNVSARVVVRADDSGDDDDGSALLCRGCVAIVRDTSTGLAWSSAFRSDGSLAVVDVGPLPQGVAHLAYSVTDAAGLSVASLETLAVHIDTLPPTASIDSSSPGHLLSTRLVNQRYISIVVRGDTLGGTEVVNLIVVVDGDASVLDVDGNTDVEFHAPALLDATHTITVGALDAAGNFADATDMLTFDVDTIPPTTTWTTAPPSPNDGHPAVLTSVADAHVGTTYVGLLAQQQLPTTMEDLDNAFWLEDPTHLGPLLPEQWWVVVLRSRDAAGNYEEDARVLDSARAFRVDRSPPAILPVEATAPPHWTGAANVTVSYTVAEEGPLTSVEAVLAGGPNDRTAAVATNVLPRSGEYDEVAVRSGDGERLEDGTWLVRVRVRDEAALWSGWLSLLFNVDTRSPNASATPATLPAIDIPDLSDADIDEEARKATALRAVASAGSDVAVGLLCEDEASPCRVEIRVVVLSLSTAGNGCENARRLQPSSGTGSDVGPAEPATDLYAQWTAVVEPPPGDLTLAPNRYELAGSVSLGGLIDGGYRLLMRGVDAAGNIGPVRAWDDVYVDTSAPAAPTLEPIGDIVDGGTVTDTIATWDVALVDDDSFGQPQVSFLWMHSFAGQSTEFQPLPLDAEQTELAGGVPTARLVIGAVEGQDETGSEPLADGAHEVVVRARDAAGNVGPPTRVRWSVASERPVIKFTRVPERRVGLDVLTIGLLALTADGEPLSDPLFEVQLDDGDWVEQCVNTASAWCEYQQAAPNVMLHVLQARVTNTAGATSDPVSTNWQRDFCGTTQFAVINATDGALECRNCPAGADCRDPLVQKESVYAREGYWTPPGSTAFDFYECPLSSCLGARPGGPNGTMLPSGCAEGYTGRLCSLCDDGWFMQFRKYVARAARAVISALIVACLPCRFRLFSDALDAPKRTGAQWLCSC